MPFLLYGEDTYRSRQKLNAIKSKYIDASLGDTNLAQIDGATATKEEIIRQLAASPFLAAKRLVIISNLITQGKKEVQKAIQDYLPKIPLTSVTFFYEEGKLDLKNILFTALNLPKLAEEFSLLPPPKLNLWIKSELAKDGSQISPDALQLLTKITGANLWRLSQEIPKLALYSDTIDKKAVEEMIYQEPEGDVFKFIDALGQRNSTDALNHLHARLALGDSPLSILGMIVFGFRNLILIEDAVNQNPPKNSVPGIHPFVFQKSRSSLKNFTKPQLRAIFNYLTMLDYACKTGIIDSEVALDFFVVGLCSDNLKEGLFEEVGTSKRAR